MAKSIALLSCDPGWRGLAFTLYIPSLNYVSTRLFHLNIDAKKGYKKPMNTIPLLVETIREQYMKEEPALCLVDKIIIESQFRANMQVLSYLIISVLQSVLASVRVETISALKCKRMFNVELGNSHHENKTRMLQYVTEHKHELIGGSTVTNHDTADSVILLNTFLKEKKRRLEHNIDNFTMAGTAVTCPNTGLKGFVRMVNKEGANQGKYFLTCDSKDPNNKGAFKWLGRTEPEPYEEDGEWYIGGWKLWNDDSSANSLPKAGAKRTRAGVKAAPLPVSKREKAKAVYKETPAPVCPKPPSGITREETLKLFADFNRTLTAYLDDKFEELTVWRTNVEDHSDREEGELVAEEEEQ